MGLCVSLQHKAPESDPRLRVSFGSKNDELLIPSPVKEKPGAVNAVDRTVADVAIKSQWLSFGGSKEEAFFDSQPWLDSDGEDDFRSVNGDFTPSRGNTPVHHSFSAGQPQANKASVVDETTLDSAPVLASSPDKKKRLSEFFKESLRSDQYLDEENAEGSENVVREKFTNGTPYRPGVNLCGSSDRPPNGVLRDEGKSVKSAQCCLPMLLSSRSFSERKKRMATPAHNAGAIEIST